MQIGRDERSVIISVQHVMVLLVVLSGATWVASWAVMSGKGLNPILLAAFGSWTSVGAPGQRLRAR